MKDLQEQLQEANEIINIKNETLQQYDKLVGELGEEKKQMIKQIIDYQKQLGIYQESELPF